MGHFAWLLGWNYMRMRGMIRSVWNISWLDERVIVLLRGTNGPPTSLKIHTHVHRCIYKTWPREETANHIASISERFMTCSSSSSLPSSLFHPLTFSLVTRGNRCCFLRFTHLCIHLPQDIMCRWYMWAKSPRCVSRCFTTILRANINPSLVSSLTIHRV